MVSTKKISIFYDYRPCFDRGKVNAESGKGPVISWSSKTMVSAGTQWFTLVLTLCIITLQSQVAARQRHNGERCDNAAGGGSGLCISAEQCSSVMQAVRRDGRTMTPETLQLLQDAHCGFDNEKPLLCCPEDELITSVVEAGQWAGETNNLEAPEGVTVSVDHPKLPLLPVDTCGLSVFVRILHGPHQFLFELEDAPTVVRLIYTTPRGEERFLCGGSLVSSRYVLTAAQCVTGLRPGFRLSGVVLGDYNVTSDPDCTTVQGFGACRPRARRFDVESVTPHPAYRPRSRRPDLALIRLAARVNFSETDPLIPTCLPLGKFQFLELRNRGSNKYLSTMGWGADLSRGPNTEELRIGTLQVVDGQRCERLVGSVARDASRIACASGKLQEDDKIADIGGPLSVVEEWLPNDGPRLVQVALLTARSQPGQPSAYTRLGPYLPWILNTIEA